MAAPRPRRAPNHGGVYMPPEYSNHVQAIGMGLLVARPRPWDPAAHFSVRALFKLTSRAANDLDNLLKTLLDAGTKVLWNDDRQVVEVYMRKVHVDANPGIHLAVNTVG